jgi:hypothetical protein
LLPLKFLLGIFLICCCSSCRYLDSEQDELEQIVAGLNQKLPQKLDSETTIDKIEVKDSGTLLYSYTLVNLTASAIDTQQFYKALWPGILSHIKVSREMKKLRDMHITIEYLYKDKTGKFIYLFKVRPEDYK